MISDDFVLSPEARRCLSTVPDRYEGKVRLAGTIAAMEDLHRRTVDLHTQVSSVQRVRRVR